MGELISLDNARLEQALSRQIANELSDQGIIATVTFGGEEGDELHVDFLVGETRQQVRVECLDNDNMIAIAVFADADANQPIFSGEGYFVDVAVAAIKWAARTGGQINEDDVEFLVIAVLTILANKAEEGAPGSMPQELLSVPMGLFFQRAS